MREKERAWTKRVEEAEKRQQTRKDTLARERKENDVIEIEREEETQREETTDSREKEARKQTEKTKTMLADKKDKKNGKIEEQCREEEQERDSELGTDTPDREGKGETHATWRRRMSSVGSYVRDGIGTAGAYLNGIWDKARGKTVGRKSHSQQESLERRKDTQNGMTVVKRYKTARDTVESTVSEKEEKPTNVWKRQMRDGPFEKRKHRIGKSPPLFRERENPPEGLPKRKLAKGWADTHQRDAKLNY
ncbi:hypothetical protein niasHS_017500 [Heterodera schachtii]|uniref:Uncharacterized protein n=1 Tax=Heterodera schachtii TaxID=97005 RepID=A0ABD2I0D5_HETSC